MWARPRFAFQLVKVRVTGAEVSVAQLVRKHGQDAGCLVGLLDNVCLAACERRLHEGVEVVRGQSSNHLLRVGSSVLYIQNEVPWYFVH